MRSSIGQRLATIVLLAGVVGGFGSGIASCARHARWAKGESCEARHHDRGDHKSAAKAAPMPTPTNPTTSTPTAEPAPPPVEPAPTPVAPVEPAPAPEG